MLSEGKKLTSVFSKVFVIILCGLILFLKCSYSFSGASVPPHLKTVSIPVFIDRSGSGEFNLGDQLTRQLIQKFVEDNTLSVSNRADANAVIEGTISTLIDAPSSITGGDKTQVSTRKITINVQVTYKDLVKKQTIFQKSFSNYGEYSTTSNVTKARKDAIDLAISRISEDILLGVVSNW
jgi:hypothetical protein